MNFRFSTITLLFSSYLVTASDHKMVSLLRSSAERELQSNCNASEIYQHGHCVTCPEGQVANTAKTRCEYCPPGSITSSIDGKATTGCTQATELSPRRILAKRNTQKNLLHSEGATNKIYNSYNARSAHGRQLSWSIFGKSLFCRKISKDEYETKEVSKLFVWWYKIFHNDDQSGSCESLCSDVCEHKDCMFDFQLSADRSTCTCIRQAVLLCGNNTHCIEDQCQCREGFVGDPLTTCIQATCNPPCGANAKCDDKLQCSCDPGYIGDPLKGCNRTCDPPCDANAQCNEQIQCTCNNGFVGNGVNCTSPDIEIMRSFNRTIPEHVLNYFPVEIFDLILEDSPTGFIPGSISIGGSGTQLLNDTYSSDIGSPNMEFLIKSEVSFLTIDGVFSLNNNSSVPSSTIVRAYTQEGQRVQSEVDTATGYFAVTLTDLPPGRIPVFLTFSSLTYDGVLHNNTTLRKLVNDDSRNGRRVDVIPSYPSPCLAWINSNINCAPALALTLTWDGPTSDLDLHVSEPNGTLVYYGKQQGLYGSLDVDDTDGYGPENYVAKYAPYGTVFNTYVRRYAFNEDNATLWKLTARVDGAVRWTESGKFDIVSSNRTSQVFPILINTTSSCETDVCPYVPKVRRLGENINESCTACPPKSKLPSALALYETLKTITLKPTIFRGLMHIFFAATLNKGATLQLKRDYEALATRIVSNMGDLECARSSLLEAFCSYEDLQRNVVAVDGISYLAANLATVEKIGGTSEITVAVELIGDQVSSFGKGMTREKFLDALKQLTKLRDVASLFISNLGSLCSFDTCPSFDGYVFWPGYDSTFHDIDGLRSDPLIVTPAQMIVQCNSRTDCKGFNTNGYYKNKIEPLRLWIPFSSNPSPTPCQGLYIKTPTTFMVNGHMLDATESKHIKFIAKYTVPNFVNGTISKYMAIRDYLGTGTWWALKEGVLARSNPFDVSLCSTFVDVTRRLSTLWDAKQLSYNQGCGETRWQLGISGLTRWLNIATNSEVEERAKSVYCESVKEVLGRNAKLAGYAESSPEYNWITALSTLPTSDGIKKVWLLKSHLVGFYFNGPYIEKKCMGETVDVECYGKQKTDEGMVSEWYAPSAIKIKDIRDEVMVLLQSLPNGPKIVCSE